MRGKGTGRIRSSRQNRKRRVRIRRNGHESLSSLRIQNPVLGGRIASAESSRRGQGSPRLLLSVVVCRILIHEDCGDNGGVLESVKRRCS